eukprot:PhM_4_TR9054/c0_g1_i1/m.60006/K09458/fabF; 3-oxoacyl-[acyl-carrier-protein] synthase II
MSLASLRGIGNRQAIRRPVVVTGLGIVSPLGCTVASAWETCVSGECRLQPLKEEDRPTAAFPVSVAGYVQDPQDDPQRYAATSRETRYLRFAMRAVADALDDAGLDLRATEDPTRVMVNIGIGIPSLADIDSVSRCLHAKQYNKISPFFVPKILGNIVSGQIANAYGAQGGAHSTVSACATGTHCIGEAFRAIERGDVDVAVAGATEACIHPIALAGFARMRALSTTASSRPFDTARDGFVMGEGCGILILESLDHALARHDRLSNKEHESKKPTMYALLRGYGTSSDGHHLTQPHPDARGACEAMRRAILDADVKAQDIRLVSAHATGTPVGDEIELTAVTQLCGMPSHEAGEDPVCVYSNKGAMGHLLGAAGGAETVLGVLALQRGVAPPNVGLSSPVATDDKKIVLTQKASTIALRNNVSGAPASMLKNSFGFGGTNASLVFTRIE